jgi:hypothetical protein
MRGDAAIRNNCRPAADRQGLGVAEPQGTKFQQRVKFTFIQLAGTNSQTNCSVPLKLSGKDSVDMCRNGFAARGDRNPVEIRDDDFRSIPFDCPRALGDWETESPRNAIPSDFAGAITEPVRPLQVYAIAS